MRLSWNLGWIGGLGDSPAERTKKEFKSFLMDAYTKSAVALFLLEEMGDTARERAVQMLDQAADSFLASERIYAKLIAAGFPPPPPIISELQVETEDRLRRLTAGTQTGRKLGIPMGPEDIMGLGNSEEDFYEKMARELIEVEGREKFEEVTRDMPYLLTVSRAEYLLKTAEEGDIATLEMAGRAAEAAAKHAEDLRDPDKISRAKGLMAESVLRIMAEGSWKPGLLGLAAPVDMEAAREFFQTARQIKEEEGRSRDPVLKYMDAAVAKTIFEEIDHLKRSVADAFADPQAWEPEEVRDEVKNMIVAAMSGARLLSRRGMDPVYVRDLLETARDAREVLRRIQAGAPHGRPFTWKQTLPPVSKIIEQWRPFFEYE